ncbi:MAG: hypothetical protein KA792_07045 [Bacteroidales bacterium]|nr:hypothetical protein [Bacteroidales bacterium]
MKTIFIYVLLLLVTIAVTLKCQNYYQPLGPITYPAGQGPVHIVEVTCSGKYYDSGGPNGSFTPDKLSYLTFKPSQAGKKIRIDFVYFDIGNGANMFIHNGSGREDVYIMPYPNPNSSQAFWGATVKPETILSSADDGAITFEVISFPGGPVYPGWEANISCVDPCTAPLLTAKANGTATLYTLDNPPETIKLTANPSSSGSGCAASWVYSWSDGKKCWNGSGFFSDVAVWSANYKDITLTNISNPGTYTVRVRCTENPGCYSESKVDVSTFTPIFQDDFETNKGWQLTGEFQRDKPKGLGGVNLNADPLAAHSGQYVLGTDLTGLGAHLGDYEAGLGDRAYTATSPTIDCSTFKEVSFEYYRWLNIYGKMGGFWYGCFIDISNDNGNKWYNIFSLEMYNSLNGYQDKQWWLLNKANFTYYKPNYLDISKYADGKSQVKIRFALGPSVSGSSALFCSGWNIDDFRVVGKPVISCTPPVILAKANGVEGVYSYCSRAGGDILQLSTSTTTEGFNCNGNWTYCWSDGLKYWDGSGFNSSVEIWNNAYRNINVGVIIGTTNYKVKVKCDGSAECSSESAVSVVALKQISYITTSIGEPANGLYHNINVSWDLINTASYQLEYSFTGVDAWTQIYEGTNNSFTHNLGDKPNIPLYYRVKTFKDNLSCLWSGSSFVKYSACDNPVLSLKNPTLNSITISLSAESPVPNPATTLYSVLCINNNKYVSTDGLFSDTVIYKTRKEWGETVVKNLSENTEYCFYATAKNNSGDLSTTGEADKVCISTVSATPVNLSGYIFYDNKQNTPIAKSKVYLLTLEGKTLDSSLTDSTGFYKFINIQGGTYMLSCMPIAKWGGVNPIDALAINRYFIGLYKFVFSLRKQAADVNADLKVNPLDALIINRRFIGILSKYPSPDWLCKSNPVTLNGSDVQFDFRAICFGDIDGSHIPINK